MPGGDSLEQHWKTLTTSIWRERAADADRHARHDLLWDHNPAALSKIAPTELWLDHRLTILLQAAQRKTEGMDEWSITAIEDAGINTLHSTYGMVVSVIHARCARQMRMSSKGSVRSSRFSNTPPLPGDPLVGLKRHQLWDTPVPSHTLSMADCRRSRGHAGGRKQTTKFDKEDVVQSYHVPWSSDNLATHERCGASHYPTIPASPSMKATPTKEGDKVQVLTLPVMSSLDDISEESGNGTAPPRLGLTVTDPFHPSRQDIFENTLSTSLYDALRFTPGLQEGNTGSA
ncbi:hypothetical protein FOMPIDRAFT_86779 [Fomitopsis schrenkii]|uniref:Uncharacterized protein n=1 Tax=Fomitopsis schrenkii TaxID=2126942 RepID=S8FXA0_FOMSC|nr:hypothetical protein FOMPIDRAFT_86779 [Fomitopsis schrenkii]